MWAQIINAVLGIWLMVAPAIFRLNKTIADNDHIIGPIIATFAITAIFECTRPVRKFNILLGSWLLIAPWVLSYEATPAIVNDMVIGIMVIGLSLVKGVIKSRFGGGWSSLWQPDTLHEQQAK